MPARINHFMHSALGLLPSLAVLGVLAALAVVGHLTGWKLSNLSGLWKSAGNTAEATGVKERADKSNASASQPIRFSSQEALEKSGIKTAQVTRQPITQYVVANGTIDYNRTRLAHLATRAPGNVWKVYKQVGDPVSKGEVLGLIESTEIGRAKAEFLQALRAHELKAENLRRAKKVEDSGALPERQLREAEAAASEAGIRLFTAEQALVNLGLPIRSEKLNGLSNDQLTARLQFLGLPESIARDLDPATTTANLLPLVAPFDGIVIRSEIAIGELVSSAGPQFTVADVRRLWVMLDIRQEDVGRVKKKQRITFRVDGDSTTEATGTVSWISTEVDDKTRMVRVRAEVDNTQGQLRARSFGTGRILISERPDAIAVPSEALQWNGSEALVFVCQSDGLSYEPRTVCVGIQNGDYTEVIDGVRPGEIVATSGSHVLRSQLFRSEIGGGDE